MYISFIRNVTDSDKDSWTTIAEIQSFADESGVVKTDDVDSAPDANFENDPGGNVDDDTNNEISGDGSGDPSDPTEDMDPTKDEDDHDPEVVEVCDAALIVNTDDDGPHSYGDTVKFNVVVYNQGNGDITNVALNNTVGAGLLFVSTDINDGANWDEEIDGDLTTIITSTIAPGDSVVVCLELMIAMDETPTEQSWLQEVEITKYEDPEDPGEAKEDLDSTPDDDPSNDPGGNPDSLTDDETGGDGSGDPEDPTDDMDPMKDEDDHDPVLIEVFDLALRKSIDIEGPYAIGDTAEFKIYLFNQGNVDAHGITVTDYLNSGFAFDPSLNSNWEEEGSLLTYDHDEVLVSGAADSIYLSLITRLDENPFPTDWYNYAEISESDTDNNPATETLTDADSNSDDVNDDNGGGLLPDTDDDDEINENGVFGDDEDDHDIEKLIVGYDLAIRKSVLTEGPYRYGDTLDYEIRIFNQGGLSVSIVDIIDVLPCGLHFEGSLNDGWTQSGDTLRGVYESEISPGEDSFINVKLIVQPCSDGSTSNYINSAEIYDFKDKDGNEPDSEDYDSTPDEDIENEDNVIDDAISDPEDEDDHDIADIKVYDLALIIYLDSMPPHQPVVPGDILKFAIEIENQGNTIASGIELANYIMPANLKLAGILDNANWTWITNEISEHSPLSNDLLPGERDTTCVWLEVVDGAMSDILTWAEITNSVEQKEEDCADADSTPDKDMDNDSGGNPGDLTDNEWDGDGTGDPDIILSDQNPEVDEDDHDGASIEVFDLALKAYVEDPVSCIVGDTEILSTMVYNQGVVSAHDVQLCVTIPSGMSLTDDSQWQMMSSEQATIMIESINSADSIMVALPMVIKEGHSVNDYITYVEVCSARDNMGRDMSLRDVDSDLDSIVTNDSGILPDPNFILECEETDDSTDNEIDESSDDGGDEDDHDVVVPSIFDLALRKTTDVVEPVQWGDTIKYDITVFNQGNIVAGAYTLIDYIPTGLIFDESINAGWSEGALGNVSITINDNLYPNDSATTSVFLIVKVGAHLEDLTNFAEITDEQDTEGEDVHDIDSTPDEINDESPIDDHISNIKDEDDHDITILPVLDLALRKTSNITGAVKEGDIVTFYVEVINQGSLPGLNVTVRDEFLEGFEYPAELNPQWKFKNDHYENAIGLDVYPGEIDTIEMFLIVTEVATKRNMLNIAEISYVEDEDGGDDSQDDIDSNPDDDLDNDVGDITGEIVDDEIEDNGDKDEDDNDPERLVNCIPMVAIGSINLSVNEDCNGFITPEMILTEVNYFEEDYTITITNSKGEIVDDHFYGDEIGQEYKVSISINEPSCDLPSVWTTVIPEYKLNPAVICNVDTVTCAQNIAFSVPEVVGNCGAATYVRGAVVREDLCKVSPTFIAKETVVYAATDQFGNVSDTCIQVRYILKPNLKEADIEFPSDTTVSCGAAIFNDSGEIDPDIAGVPIWDGVDLYSNRDIPKSCNVFADYEDIQDLDVSCRRTIIRRWTVTEWKCEGGASEFSMLQRIMLTDEVAPTIELETNRIDLSVNESTCSASVVIPEVMVSDNCQADSTIEVEVRYPGGTSLASIGSVISIPIGDDQIIEYIARDICGNERRDTTYVNVIDRTDPIAVCLRDMVVSITDTIVSIGVDKFDENSYDACDIVDKCVVRMDDHLLLLSLIGPSGDVLFDTFDKAMSVRTGSSTSCYRDYSASTYERAGRAYINPSSICTPKVSFCCTDGGKDVPVILRVSDKSGNQNECMVMVAVQDKSDPVITCPTEEIVVSCDFDFDEDGDLNSLFGTIRNGLEKVPLVIPAEYFVSSSGDLVNGTYIDNCVLGDVIEERVVDRDSICRTGSIIRRFSIVLGGDTSQVCQQLIRIVGDQANNPLEWDYFPKTEKLIAQSPSDVKDLAKSNPPTIRNAGCSLIGLGYSDQAFRLDTGAYCTKIVRTWQVIDWCRNPTGLIELDSVQYILVVDDEAPEITFNSGISLPQPLSGDAIELTAVGSDNVVLNPRFLDWSYEVYADGETLIRSGEISFTDFRNSSAVIRLEGLQIGDYKVHWIVEDPCGNQDTGIQDISIVDRDQESSFQIAGAIHTLRADATDIEMMDNVTVHLSESHGQYVDAITEHTNEEGVFAFLNMPSGSRYFVDPIKDDDHLNGVTTLDLILIQRHILGLQELENPKLRLAADVNGDNRVSTLDLVEIRRILLGYTDGFKDKESWMFYLTDQPVNTDFDIAAPLAETYHVADLDRNMDIPFVGIKTGDVSGDAIGQSGLAGSRAIGLETWLYEISEEQGLAKIEIKAASDMAFSGYQGVLSWSDDAVYESMISGKMKLAEDHINASKVHIGKLPMVFENYDGLFVKEGDVLFTLYFKAMENSYDIKLEFDQSRLSSEVYDDDEPSRLLLEKVESQIRSDFMVYSNTPNPWSELTYIKTDVQVSGQLFIRVYDVHNRLMHQESHFVNKGAHSFIIDEEDIESSGLYFYEVEIEGHTSRHKMIKVN